MVGGLPLGNAISLGAGRLKEEAHRLPLRRLAGAWATSPAFLFPLRLVIARPAVLARCSPFVLGGGEALSAGVEGETGSAFSSAEAGGVAVQ